MALIHLPHVKWTLVDVTCQCHVVFIHINCKATIIPSALHVFIHWIDYYMTWSLNLFMNKIFKLNSFTWRQFFLENVEIFGKKSMHGREKDDGILRNQKRIFYEFNDPKRRYEGRRFSGCLPNEACINFFHAINSKQKCTGIKAIRNRLK